MNEIEQNPFRYLGLFANATLKEQTAQLAQVKAFARVGRQVDNPLYLRHLLEPLPSDEETIALQESRIAFPDERKRHAMFWFDHGQHPEEDLKAVALIDKGRMKQSVELWEKNGEPEALHNLMVAELLGNHLEKALSIAQRLYHDEEDIRQLIEALKDDFRVNEKGLLRFVTDSVWTSMLKEEEVATLKQNIERSLEYAKYDDSIGSYEALYETSSDLDRLRVILGPYDVTFQTLSEKMANMLLDPQFAPHLLTNPTKWFDRAYEVAIEADTKEYIAGMAVAFYETERARLASEFKVKVPPLGNYNGSIPDLREYARAKKAPRRWQLGCGVVGIVLSMVFAVICTHFSQQKPVQYRPPEIKMPEPITLPDMSKYQTIPSLTLPKTPEVTLPPKAPKHTKQEWKDMMKDLPEKEQQELLERLSRSDMILPDGQTTSKQSE